MSFKSAVESDIHKVFLNLGEFAEERDILYDGVLYENVPIVLTGLKENDRHRSVSGYQTSASRQYRSDNVQGLYIESRVAHLAQKDLGGYQPENGMKFRIYDADKQFYTDYRIAASVSDMGMLRVELTRTTE